MNQYLEKSKAYKSFHYSKLAPQMLEYLHARTLGMLSVIKSLFEKNQICYMICGGTLLGAVTSGKFIPWDDDVDVCIPEDDYERAKQILITQVPNWIAVQCKETEPNYYHGWMKVRDKQSKVYPFEKAYQENGVWIDIYKLKKIRNNEIDYQIKKEHLNYLIRRRFAGAITTAEMLMRIFSNKLISQMLKGKMRSLAYNKGPNKYIIWSASKITLEETWCFPTKLYTFENIPLYSFNNAEEYLRRHYGDSFTQLPPENMRLVGIQSIDF